jgi:phosphate transport system substrate-binding protein
MAKVENKAGKYVAPTIEGSRAALSSVQLPEDLIAWVSDPAGAESYPIVTYTWLLCYKKYADPGKAKALKDVITYGLTEGQKTSPDLGYIPLPDAVVAKAKAALVNIK